MNYPELYPLLGYRLSIPIILRIAKMNKSLAKIFLNNNFWKAKYIHEFGGCVSAAPSDWFICCAVKTRNHHGYLYRNDKQLIEYPIKYFYENSESSCINGMISVLNSEGTLRVIDTFASIELTDQPTQVFGQTDDLVSAKTR